MPFDLSNSKISFRCPECHFSNTVSLGQVQRGEKIICSGCHKTIQLSDKDLSTKRATDQINKSVEDLERVIDRFNRS